MRTIFSLIGVCFLFNVSIANAEIGKYFLGGSIGQSEFDSGFSNPTGSSSYDEENNGFKFFGGVRLNDFISLEGHYGEIGEVKIRVGGTDSIRFNGIPYSPTEANDLSGAYEISSLGIGVCARLPICKQVHPLFKVGYHRWEITQDSEVSGDTKTILVGIPVEESGGDIYYGVGLDIFFLSNALEDVAMRIDFERFEYNVKDLDFFSVGLVCYF